MADKYGEPPLPESVRSLLAKGGNTHPGLELDKYAKSWFPEKTSNGGFQEYVQKPTIERIISLSKSMSPTLFNEISVRRDYMLEVVGARMFIGKNISPLTLHLSRASTLENAGICLNHLYGFAYLPGSGLKGMARSFAQNIWRKAQVDKVSADSAIGAIFGKSKSADCQDESAGQVVFHDAWPAQCPQLQIDITNNHHGAYYDAQGKYPGDWENPIPVYFLAIKEGVNFKFAVSKRNLDVRDELLDIAQEWLKSALCHLGAGAKTFAGYGRFEIKNFILEPQSSHAIKSYSTELTLVTPAFLAGAKQDQSDCTLRPATLKGLLRWWWRTMHAGYLTAPDLLKLENAVWGSKETGSPISVTILPGKPERLHPIKKYDKEAIQRSAKRTLPGDRKPTQGLWYMSYGMDDGPGKPSRYYACPGSSWTVTLTARASRFGSDGGVNIPADQIIKQAKAALWLLCHHGGVGAKSRRGFGSLEDVLVDGIKTEDDAIDVGEQLRNLCKLKSQKVAQPQTSSFAREHREMTEDIPIGEIDDVWGALDNVGRIYQKFAKDKKRNDQKIERGMPRKIGEGPNNKHPKHDRHSSPVHFHIAKQDKKYMLRVTAFFLGSQGRFEVSREILNELLGRFRTKLKGK